MRDFMAQSKSPEPTVESVLEKVHDLFSNHQNEFVQLLKTKEQIVEGVNYIPMPGTTIVDLFDLSPAENILFEQWIETERSNYNGVINCQIFMILLGFE